MISFTSLRVSDLDCGWQNQVCSYIGQCLVWSTGTRLLRTDTRGILEHCSFQLSSCHFQVLHSTKDWTNPLIGKNCDPLKFCPRLELNEVKAHCSSRHGVLLELSDHPIGHSSDYSLSNFASQHRVQFRDNKLSFPKDYRAGEMVLWLKPLPAEN